MSLDDTVEKATIDQYGGSYPIDAQLIQRASGQTSPLDAAIRGNKQIGPLARIVQGVRYMITGAGPEAWMGPLQPLAPMAPDTKGRQFDYRVGQNIQSPRRGDRDLVDAWQLRALADNCDILRLAIETRKDQMVKLKWNVAHEDPAEDVSDDKAVKDIETKLRYPDNQRTWQNWLRMLMEELLVIDAATIYPRLDQGGNLWGLELMDGATIKVLISGDGRRPLPPEPAYEQWLKGSPTSLYTSDELLYAPRNERVWKVVGMSPVEQIMLTVNTAIRRQVSQLQYFTEGNIPEAFGHLPETWTAQQIQQFQNYWDTMIEGVQSFKRKIKFLPALQKVTMAKDAPIKDEFDEWLARVICYALSLPPTAFVRQMNRATSETAQDAALEEGLAPLMQWVEDLMCMILAKYFKRPDLRFRWNESHDVAPDVQAKIDDINLRNGSAVIDDIRSARGQDPYENGIGSRPLIYTANGVTPLDVEIKNADNPPEPPPALAISKPGQQSLNTPPEPNNKQAEKTRYQSLSKKGYKERPGLNEKLIAPLEKSLTRAFKATALSVAKQLAKSLKLSETTAKVSKAKKPKQISDTAQAALSELDLSLISTLSYDDLQGAITDAATDGAQQTLTQIDISDDGVTNLANERAIKWAGDHAASLITSDGEGGELIDATRDMIRDTIVNAEENGWSISTLSDQLEKDYAFSPARAELIARTELKMADMGGAMAGAHASGVVKQKEWLISNEDNVCEECQANAEQGAIDLDDDFDSGDASPPSHPNCNCVINFITGDDDESD